MAVVEVMNATEQCRRSKLCWEGFALAGINGYLNW